MELRSRLLFLDTNIYEGKNFQFLTNSLGSLKRLVDEGEVHLLITEVTKGEVVGHIRKKVKLALAEVKALKKKAMILRNVPDIPAHGIFSDASAEEVSQSIISNFETFLDSDHVEMVSIDNVRPSYVFSRFFSSQAPFAVGEKEKEFADAFVLKALDELSQQRGHIVHIVSSDKDMLRFSEETPHLVCTESIDEFIDAVNKSVSIEPAAFAEQALERMRPHLMELVKDCVVDVPDDFKVGGWDSTLISLTLSDIELSSANLISVDAEACVYELSFFCVAETTEIEKDYDRSPFDHEDDSYSYVLENQVSRTIDVEGSMNVRLSYQDKLLDSVELDWDEYPKLKLSMPYNVIVREADADSD